MYAKTFKCTKEDYWEKRRRLLKTGKEKENLSERERAIGEKCWTYTIYFSET